jgi:hypothetical protein
MTRQCARRGQPWAAAIALVGVPLSACSGVTGEPSMRSTLDATDSAPSSWDANGSDDGATDGTTTGQVDGPLAGEVNAASPDGGNDGTLDAPSVESSEAAIVDDGAVQDANNEGALDAGPQSDPCPTSPGSGAVILNCDPACPAYSESVCRVASCLQTDASFSDIPVLSVTDRPSIFRTPSSPGTAPVCATTCFDGGVSYGFELQPTPSISYPYLVITEPPWKILYEPPVPYCAPPNSAATNCVEFDPSSQYYTSPDFLIVTNDPNAPARNIQIETATPAGCP